MVTLRVLKYDSDRLSDELHVCFLHAARCNCGCSQSQTARNERRLRIVGNSVLVDSDVDLAEKLLCKLSCHAHVLKIKEHEVVVRTARNKIEAVLYKLRSKCLSVLDDLSCVLFVLGLKILTESNGLCSDNVHKRSALDSGEDRFVEFMLFSKFLA